MPDMMIRTALINQNNFILSSMLISTLSAFSCYSFSSRISGCVEQLACNVFCVYEVVAIEKHPSQLTAKAK
jgi:hypothetical protein